MRILIVDEDVKFAENFKASLLDLGYESDSAADYSTALEIFREKKHAVVVTDHNVAKLNAIELMKSLREINAKVLVIIASANIDIESACDAVNYRANAMYNRKCELRDMLILLEAANLKVHPTGDLQMQHSKLAFEYAKLKLAYDDLRGAN